MSRLTTFKEWQAEGRRRFGRDTSKWRFKCPCCGQVATPADWEAAGAPESAVAFSCVGRWVGVSREAFARTGKGPCNYAGGGLLRMNPVSVMDPEQGASHLHQIFDFADEPLIGTYSILETEDPA